MSHWQCHIMRGQGGFWKVPQHWLRFWLQLPDALSPPRLGPVAMVWEGMEKKLKCYLLCWERWHSRGRAWLSLGENLGREEPEEGRSVNNYTIVFLVEYSTYMSFNNTVVNSIPCLIGYQEAFYLARLTLPGCCCCCWGIGGTKPWGWDLGDWCSGQ